jgi:hypothetical protein
MTTQSTGRSRRAACRCGVCGLVLATLFISALAAQSVVPTSAALIGSALAAERDGRFAAAIEDLYRLVREHPRSGEALRGRLRLAQLLALSGQLNAALLQCQEVRDVTGSSGPERQEAIDLSTTLVRELRAKSVRSGYFPSIAASALRGLDKLDEPTALVVGAGGSMVVADRGRKRVYGVNGGAITTLASANNPTAATLLADGTLAVADKNGLLLAGNRSTLTGSWGGRTRDLDDVRSIAANSRGEFFVVDGSYNGVLRCGGSGACEPFGVAEKARTVKVGVSDYVYILDDGDSMVRVFDQNGAPVATVGPQIGTARLRDVRDIAVDKAYGIYLLDVDSKSVQVARLRLMEDGRLRAVPVTAARIPESETSGLERPYAVGVSADGAVFVVGRSSSRMVTLQ